MKASIVALLMVLTAGSAFACDQAKAEKPDFLTAMHNGFQENLGSDSKAAEIAYGTMRLKTASGQSTEVDFYAWYSVDRLNFAINAEASPEALSAMAECIIQHPAVVRDENPHLFVTPYIGFVWGNEDYRYRWSAIDCIGRVLACDSKVAEPDHAAITFLWLEYRTPAEAKEGLRPALEKLQGLGAIKSFRVEETH